MAPWPFLSGDIQSRKCLDLDLQTLIQSVWERERERERERESISSSAQYVRLLKQYKNIISHIQVLVILLLFFLFPTPPIQLKLGLQNRLRGTPWPFLSGGDIQPIEKCLDLDLQTLIQSQSQSLREREREREREHLQQCSVCETPPSVQKHNFSHPSFSYFTFFFFFPTPPIKLKLGLQIRLGSRPGQTSNSNPPGPIKLSSQSKTEPPGREGTINKYNFDTIYIYIYNFFIKLIN